MPESSAINWLETEREYTTLFEAEIDGFETWLEWNERVSAYRFGFLPPANPRGERIPSESSLGFADDCDAAKNVLLEAIQQYSFEDLQHSK
jgi:hypothetical protein